MTRSLSRWELDVYMGEIVLQCRYAQDAAMHFRESLSSPDPFSAFMWLRRLLDHSAAISRLLWPGKLKGKDRTEFAKMRGKCLREALGLVGDTAVTDRSARNHLQHIDERIDDWLATSKQKNFARQNIGPTNMIGGLATTDIFEHYVPNEDLLVFRGDRYEISKILAATEDILSRANAWERRISGVLPP